MKKTLAIAMLVALFSIGSPAMADIVYANGTLTTSSPTAHATGQSTAGSGVQYYDAFVFTVDTTGPYVVEFASPNSTGTPSNAVDTWVGIFANTFTPPALGAALFSNDDFTGTLTVLPGPYSANGVTANSTGFTGLQPGSRLGAANLTAGTQYFLYASSFRETNYVATGTNGQATGAYYVGMSGPGIISLAPIPEPTSMTLCGVALAGFAWKKLRRRKA